MADAETMPNFVDMDAPTLLETCKDSGQMWARAFIQIIDKIGRDKIDESLMIGWFANAIESSHDFRRRLAEKRRAADQELIEGARQEAD